MEFLSFKYLKGKRVKTYFENRVVSGKIVAQGAFQIEIENTGTADIVLQVPQGQKTIPSGGTYTFPGAPYIIRNDEINYSFSGAAPNGILIIYHRIVNEGGDKNIGDVIYSVNENQ